MGIVGRLDMGINRTGENPINMSRIASAKSPATSKVSGCLL